MIWWAWVLLWLVLAIGAVGVFFLVGRSLWRKGMALLTELGTASERLSVVADELETISRNAEAAEDLAVFADPTVLRQQRILAARSSARRKGRPTSRGTAHR